MSAADPAARASGDEQNQGAVRVLHAGWDRVRASLNDAALIVAEPTGAADRHGMVARVGMRLRAQALMEQEVAGPAVAGVLGAEDASRLAQARAEALHALERLAACDPATPAFVDAINALAAAAHHYGEHSRTLLAGALSRLGAQEQQTLGTAMAQRREQLLGDQGVD